MNATTTLKRTVRAETSTPPVELSRPAQVFTLIGELLRQARDIDDDKLSWEGFSLLKLASNQSLYGSEDDNMTQIERESTGYEIAALLKAVRAIPGDVCPQRDRLIDEITPLLIEITEDPAAMDCVFSTSPDLEDAAGRRRLAFKANLEIEQLASMLTAVETARYDGNSAGRIGICSRISFLTQLVFYAGALFEGSAEDVGVPSLYEMQQRFNGFYS